MTALSYTCPECLALPGIPCLWTQPNPEQLFHERRNQAADAHKGDGLAGDVVSKEAFERAVEADSELF